MPIQRNQLGKNSIDRDTRNLRTRLNIQGVAGGTVTDHGLLLGLADDDHVNYVHLSSARAITAQHSFSPASPQSPFVLGTNAKSQTVPFFRADELNRSILQSGLGLSGGGLLNVNQTITLTSSSAPGAAAAILATNSSGYLRIVKLGLGVAPVATLHLLGTGTQIQAEYDASNYMTATISSTGKTTFQTIGTTDYFEFLKRTEIVDTDTPQLKVSYDGANYLDVDIDVNGNATFKPTGAQGSFILNPAGDVVMDPVGNDVLPLTSYDINLGTLTKKYLTIHAAELWIQTLVALEVMATIGGRVLVGPTTILAEDFSGANLLLNPDFEERTGDNFDNWTEDESGDGSQITAETADPHKGSSYVRLTAGTQGEGDLFCDSMVAVGGESYRIDLWYRNSSAPYGARLSTICTGGGGSLAGRDLDTQNSNWTFASLRFTVQDICTGFRIHVFCPNNDNEWVEVDDIRLYQDNLTVEHNQMDNNDVAILEGEGKFEAVKIKSLGIDGGTQGSKIFDLDRDHSTADNDLQLWPVGKKFQIRGSTGNDGTYTVNTATWVGGGSTGHVELTVDETIPSATFDGYIAYLMDDVTGPFEYFRTRRSIDATPGVNDWWQGDAIFNTGKTGDGYIDLYSVSGVHSGSTFGPTIAGMVRTSEGTWPAIEERWAIGNLNGMYGYAADEYGAAFGEPAGTRITIEPTSGIKFYSNNTPVGQFDLAGGFWIGDSATSARLSFNTTEGLQIHNSSNQRVMRVGLTGEFYIGTSINQERLTWNSTNGLQMYNASNVAVFSFPTSGNAKIVGTLEIVNPGALTAGGGAVVLDPSGILIDSSATGYVAAEAIKFNNGTEDTFRFYTFRIGGISTGKIRIPPVAGDPSRLAIEINSPNNSFAENWLSISEDATEQVHWRLTADSGHSTHKQRALLYSNSGVGPISLGINEFDPLNIHNTGGITINQLTADNEIISFKSSDIAHAITVIAETDTYGFLKKVNATQGGLYIVGLSESTYNIGVLIDGIAGVSQTTTSTGAVAPILLVGWQKSSSNRAVLANADNVLTMRNAATARWILKGDGEVHNDFATTMTLYDREDDVQLLRTFDLKSSALEIADTWFNKNLQKLQNLGIIHDVRPDGMFVSQQKMTKLQIGAIWQLYNRIEELERRLDNGI